MHDQPLQGTRILSLALNLPGPAALMRCRALGATCTKIEPPGGDPMKHYSAAAYAELHDGVEVLTADLKRQDGRALLERELSRTDVLLTSFRPSALVKLGLDFPSLQPRFPSLSQVAIVGAPGPRAEEPGHDLTYLAEHGLVTGVDLPPTLYADMGGALMSTEAVLTLAMSKTGMGGGQAHGRYVEVALADAAAWLGIPRRWGMTRPEGMVGGVHAGYRVYPCRDGRVAVAALEPHFAAALCAAAGLPPGSPMTEPATHAAIEAFLAGRTRAELERLAAEHDVPLHTLA